MPRDIILALDVPADAEATFLALTTQEGQASFWTTDCDVSDTDARFGFPGAPVDVHMQVDAAEDRSAVRWTCASGFPGWDGSVVEWELTDPQGDSGTGVVFRHLGLDGPAATEVALGSVAHTWAMILDRLQTYLRDGDPVPYFS